VIESPNERAEVHFSTGLQAQQLFASASRGEVVSLVKMPSDVNAFEISNIQGEETEVSLTIVTRM